MLSIPEGSFCKRSYAGCSIHLNFVMFIISQLLMWATLGRFKLPPIRCGNGSMCAGGQRRGPAWLPGRAPGSTDGRSARRPVGEEAGSPRTDNGIPQFAVSLFTTNALKQNAWLSWSPWLHANARRNSSCPCSGPEDLASAVEAKRLFCSRETSKQLQRFILSLAWARVANAAWRLLPSAPLLSSTSQGFECPCSPNCGSSAGMNEAFSRTRLYEWDRLCITRQEAPRIS